MKSPKSIMIIIASIGVIGPIAIPSIADVETTTVKTTTRIEGQPIQLKSNVSYILVDPLTGDIRNDFDPTQQIISVQSVPSGSVIVEQSTGKPIATFNSAGKAIDILTAPSFDPLSSSIDARRSELNHLINDALANRTITEAQAKDLRASLDLVGKRQADDTSRGKVLIYSEAIYLASQLNDIDDRFVSLTHSSALPPLIGARFIIKDNEVIMSR